MDLVDHKEEQPVVDDRTLYVRNIGKMSGEILRSALSEFGEISQFEIHRVEGTKKKKYYASLTYTTIEAAEEALHGDLPTQFMIIQKTKPSKPIPFTKKTSIPETSIIPPAEVNKTIYIRHIGKMSGEVLRCHMAEFGEITRFAIERLEGSRSCKKKFFALITYTSVEAAEMALTGSLPTEFMIAQSTRPLPMVRTKHEPDPLNLPKKPKKKTSPNQVLFLFKQMLNKTFLKYLFLSSPIFIYLYRRLNKSNLWSLIQNTFFKTRRRQLITSVILSFYTVVSTQLVYVGLKTPRLPPAPGPISGIVRVHNSNTTADLKKHNQTQTQTQTQTEWSSTQSKKIPSQDGLKVLIFGDSVAAGVGCPSHEKALAGSVARKLAEHASQNIYWHALGTSGYTAKSMDKKLVSKIPCSRDDKGCEALVDVRDASARGDKPSSVKPAERRATTSASGGDDQSESGLATTETGELNNNINPEPSSMSTSSSFTDVDGGFDCCVVSVGVNHVLSLHTPSTYEDQLKKLLIHLKQKLGKQCQILVCAMPPMEKFPHIDSLFPLNRLIGWYASSISSITLQVCENNPELARCVTWDLSRVIDSATAREEAKRLMAPDGFHPGTGACDIMADDIVKEYNKTLMQITTDSLKYNI